MARLCAIKTDGVGSVLVKSKFRWAKTYVQEYIPQYVRIGHRETPITCGTEISNFTAFLTFEQSIFR